MVKKNSRIFVFLVVFTFMIISIGGLTYIARAGTLEFDGVPVDITTSTNEDLVIVPGEGGNTQVGDASGTNTNATDNDDLHITGILEVDGIIYSDSGLTTASNITPDTDSNYSLGGSTAAWLKMYVDTITGVNAALSLTPATGYGIIFSAILNAATGDEVAYDLSATINKAAGNYTGLKLDITETSAPGSADKLLDLLIGGTSYLQVYNATNSEDYGRLSLGSAAWDGSTAGYFRGPEDGTQIAVNAPEAFEGNLIDLQLNGSSMFIAEGGQKLFPHIF